ncbi:MAG TPA: EF-P lysine aminoacylase EpmA [Nevskiaceae bacterium]|nr:EF-P lysine aminoacylase EpmA [Nevskiaceae bacterium]
MSWRPSATLETLKARAELLASVRAFFSARGVMEVDTPILSRRATVDRHIDSFAVSPDDRWLHTSPEFAMKRLLAAGSGPIYQLCHVFRVDEAGRHHNPEFTMLEWYRPGWDHWQLMDEVEGLFSALVPQSKKIESLTYRQAFLRHARFDPFIEDRDAARHAFDAACITLPESLSEWDAWLDVAMSILVAPALQEPTFLYDFPASQAALARVRDDDPPVAERFELFWKGIELANGFHELTDAAEQRRRFEADQAWRREQGKVVPPYDAHLIDALASGMPQCAGVALGIDRLLMLKLGLPSVASAIAFDSDRA